MNYYIKNATLVNEGQTFVASVFVSDGKIAKIIRESQVPELVEGPVDTESAFRQAQRPSAKSLTPQANTSSLALSMSMCISVSPV